MRQNESIDNASEILSAKVAQEIEAMDRAGGQRCHREVVPKFSEEAIRALIHSTLEEKTQLVCGYESGNLP